MTKLFSAKHWIAFVSCCVLATGIALACAFDDEPEYGMSNFTPETFVDSSYSPFLYSSNFYYLIGHDEQQRERFDSTNAREWSAYLGGALSTQTLGYLLTAADITSIDSLVNLLTKTGPAASNQSPAFLKAKTDGRLASFLTYLAAAKQAEAFSLSPISEPWIDPKPASKKKDDYSAFNAKLLNAFTKTTDAFIKERYWFQLVRSYFFTQSAQKAIAFFNQYEKTMVHNTIYYRTQAYAAGAYYKLKKFSRANYYYSKVFANCDALKTTAHYSFHPQENADWDSTLALCANKDEKATLWQMLGIFYGDEQRSIEEIFALNPGSTQLDILLARLVNKIETNAFASPGEQATGSKFNDTASAGALVARIAESGRTAKPWIWHMANGYLYTLSGKYDLAEKSYTKAAKTLPAGQMVNDQLRLLRLINYVYATSKPGKAFEKKALPDLRWLKNLPDSTVFRHQNAWSSICSRLAKTYQAENDPVRAECFVSTPAFYASPERIEKLKAFLLDKNNSAYDAFCASLSDKKATDLDEYQAIRLTYADSLDAAISRLSASTGAATELLGNPFNGRIIDCHDCDHEAAKTVVYTKLSLLKKLKELRANLANGKDVYNNALLLGNAYYNLTHFGNARVFFECKVIGSDHAQPEYIDSVFRARLVNMQLAEKFYQQAFSASTTDEQRAKCQYLLAKCQRNNWYNENIYLKPGETGEDDGSMVDLSALTHFKDLQQYANTQYYKEALKECGYLVLYTKSFPAKAQSR